MVVTYVNYYLTEMSMKKSRYICYVLRFFLNSSLQMLLDFLSLLIKIVVAFVA